MACCYAVVGYKFYIKENARTSATLYIVVKIRLVRLSPYKHKLVR